MKRIAVVVITLLFAASTRADDELTLTVNETAGLRRFGYPVYVKLKLPREATAKDRFRLLEDGKPVAAQFRMLKDDKKAVAVDFAVSCEPRGGRGFTVEFGEKVEAGPEPKGGLKLEEGKEAFTVTSGGMKYVVRRDLRGLLDSVRDGKKEFVREKSGGLTILPGKLQDVINVGGKGVKASVVRQGPLAVALRFESEYGDKDRVASAVELTFPRSKSWVEVNWVVTGHFLRRAAEVNLVTAGSPALADFGAASCVYTTLKKGEAARLEAWPGFSAGNSATTAGWKLFTGKDEKWQALAVHAGTSDALAEGWAHLMDRQRCTAVAVAGFGRYSRDEIRLDGGRVRLGWDRVPGADRREEPHRFWLHFVDAPVQVGALTSPQAMLAPLAVEVK